MEHEVYNDKHTVLVRCKMFACVLWEQPKCILGNFGTQNQSRLFRNRFFFCIIAPRKQSKQNQNTTTFWVLKEHKSVDATPLHKHNAARRHVIILPLVQNINTFVFFLTASVICYTPFFFREAHLYPFTRDFLKREQWWGLQSSCDHSSECHSRQLGPLEAGLDFSDVGRPPRTASLSPSRGVSFMTARERWDPEVSEVMLDDTVCSPPVNFSWREASDASGEADGETGGRNYVWVQIVFSHYFGCTCAQALSWGREIIMERGSSDDNVRPTRNNPPTWRKKRERERA